MKKDLLSIVKFFSLAIVFLAFSFSVNAERRGLKNLTDSSKAGYPRFAPAPFKADAASKYRATDFGNALNFDGVNDFVTISATGFTFPNNEWTEEMWLYLPAVPSAQFTGVIGSEDMTVWSKRGPFLQITSVNGLHGGFGYGTGQTQHFYDFRNVLVIGAWNHVAQTYDGSRLKVYVNGNIVGDVSAPSTVSNANPIKYLSGEQPGVSIRFKGSMDEVRFWKRARTEAEIKSNYNKIVNASDPDLLLYYSFNQGVANGDNTSISSVTDNTGKFNGSLNNFTLNGTSSNFVGSFFLEAPTANAATNITDGSFTANWAAPSGVTVNNYILEVARDANFISLVSGYENLSVPAGTTSQAVTGLSPNSTYYYRVKAVSGAASSLSSNVIQVKTLALTGSGNALNFDGSDDYVTFSKDGISFPNNRWTEEMWVYVPSSIGGGFKNLLVTNLISASTAPLRGPVMYVFNKTQLSGGYGDGTNWKYYITSKGAFQLDAWTHIAQTYDGTNLKVYVNGVFRESFNMPGISNVNKVNYIGNAENAPSSEAFLGNIDEVRIWSRALTEAEIKSNYDKTVDSSDPDLLLYYSFNQGVANGNNTSISSVTDNTGKFNGSFNNFTLNGTSSNFVNSFLEAPTANAATNITDCSFTANWAAPSWMTVNNYILSVAKDASFASLVPGYENLSLPAGTISQAITGLSPDFTYYYRVRALSGSASSFNSNVIQVKTLALTGFGNALNFDGTDDYVAFSKGGISFPNNGWTEEMWVYVPSSIGGGFKNLLVTNLISASTAQLRAPVMYVYNKTQLSGGYGDGTNWKYYITSKEAFQLDAWTHIAQTFDGTSLKVYVNGVFRESFNMPGISNVNKVNYIGNAENAPSSEAFLGNIDEVRIWSRALTEAEIKKNYNISIDQSAVGVQDLLAYYDFNQGIAEGNNTLIDTLIDSKNAYNAALNNFTKDGARSNFVGDLKLVPPVASAADNVVADSFKAKWAAGATSVPVAVKYFLDVSTDATFADAGKFVSGYRNKDVGNVTDFDVKGLNSGTTYYYRLRAGYAAPWYHPSVNSNTITVSTMQANNIALAATDVKTYGDAPYQLAVSSSGTGAYTYTITAGDAVSISNTGQVTILKAGTATIAVTQAADAVYGSAGPATQTITVQLKRLTVTVTAADKEYNGSDAANVTLLVTGTVYGDIITATAGGATFDNKNVGTGKPVTVTGITLSGAKASNYALVNTPATTATITAKPVKIILKANNKKYDGNAAATGSLTVDGVITGDNVTATAVSIAFADKNAGTGKTVTATGINLSSNNYTAITPVTSTGNITAKVVTVTFKANNKVFDNNTTATGVLTVTDLEAGDVATATATAMNFADPAVGTVKTVTATGISINNANYAPLNTTATSTANISGKSVTVTINQVSSKVYNGNTSASATFNISGLATGETLTVISADVTFADKNAGTGKPVTATNFKFSDVNYSAANSSATSTGNITAKVVTVTFKANNKVFDNNTAATGVLTVTDLEAGDAATATATAMNFADPAIGTVKTVTATGISINNANYAPLNTTATSTANISGKSVTVTINQVSSKVYNGNTSASATFNISGLAAGETLTVISADVTFADKNAGTGKPVTATNFKFSDVNYSAANSSATSTGNITAKVVTVTFKANNKVFDNNTTATGVLTVTDLEAGDAATATATAMNFADPAIGTVKTVTATGISINNANYAPLNTTATSTANISGKSVTVTINQVSSKVYDGNTSASATFNISGLAAGETLTVISADVTFADKNAGTGKPVTATNFKFSDVNYSAANSSATSTGNITAKVVTVTFKANNKVFDNNTAATGVLTVTDLEAGDAATATATAMNFADPAIGTGKTVTATGISINNANYAPLNTTATSTANISGKSVTVTINQVSSKVYNGNTSASATFNISGLAAGETLTVISADVTFADKNAGTGKPVTATNFKFSDVNYSAANSSATSTGNITAKVVTVTFKANNKVFDNNTAATGVLTVTDLEAGDAATATATAMNFADPAIGTGKTVTATGISINNANYAPLNTTATSTANISGKSVTVTINQVSSKVYNGNTSASATFNISGLAAGETLTVISADVTFADKNAGTGKPVTATNFKFSDVNYSAANSSATSTGNITAKVVTVTFKANNKVFDNNTTATGVLTVTDLEAGDAATATATAMNFADPAIGTVKTVTATGISINNANYAPLNTTATSTANISGKSVTVTINQVSSKVYDGNTSASATFNISGLAAGETLTVISADVTFADKNAGTGKPVTATNFKFSDVNYSAANSSATSTGNITAKVVTVTFKANNKVFDNNTAATGVLTVTDLEAGDAATATATAMNFADPAIGTGKTVTATGISINNANYAPLNTTATSTANISGKLVTVIINQVSSKVYDGNTTASATFNISGLAAGETLTVISADVTFVDKNVGTGKPVTATNFKFSDANYSAANSSANYKGNITAKPVKIILTVNDKEYDGSLIAGGMIIVSASDLVSGETITATASSITFADKNVGTDKPVTATGINLSNNNYMAITPVTSTANITAKAVTVTFKANDKVFDNNTTATGVLTVTGLEAGDVAAATAAAMNFADPAIGTGKTVTATGISINNANYRPLNTTATSTANISGKGVTVTVNQVASKVYNGNTTASATFNITGLAAGETLTVISADVTFADKNVGTGKPVTATNFKFSDVNYSASNSSATSTGNITPKDLIITADNKTKLPGEDNPPLTASYSGFVSGENNTNALTAQPLLTTPATKASPPGNYPIEISGAVAANSNYNIIYNKGALTISTVVITAVTLTTNTLYANSPKGTLAGTLTASSTEPNAIYAYSLVPGVVDNGKFIINGDKLYTNAVFDYATQNTFTVRIQVNTQSGGMLTKDFILAILYVNGSPTIDAIPDQSICVTTENNTINLSGITPGAETSQTTSLSITGNNKDMFNDLSIKQLSDGKGIINYSLKAGVSGSAVITVTVKDDGGTADGGVDSYSVSFTVNVNPLPVINISTSTGKLRVIRGRTIELTATATGTTVYSWTDAKGIISDRNTARLRVKPTERTVYTVKATSAAGCVDVKQIAIEVGNEYSDVIANNIITPNGDGVNDVWVIENIEQYPNATVKVFDIARRLVFSQTNYDNKWNGYFKDKPLHEGTYYYVIDFGTGLYKAKGYVAIINEQ